MVAPTHDSVRHVRSRNALLAELPLVVGVLLGIGVLTFQGFAFVSWPGPHGNSWDQYRLAAHLVAYPDDFGHSWPTMRLSLYPALLALLGETHGYTTAASLISSTAICLMVLAAGLWARALATPVAGGIAAFSVALVPEVLKGVILMDPYPLLGATYGLGLALAACCARWPHPALAAMAGLWGGLSWGVDSRGVLAVVIGILLVVLGATRLRGASRVFLVGAFALSATVGPVAQHLLRPPAQVVVEAEDNPDESATLLGLLGSQRKHSAADVEELIQTQPWLGLADPCAEGLPMMPGLDPCSIAMLDLNLQRQRSAGNLPHFAFLALLALALLPTGSLRRGDAWRSSLGSVLGLMVPLLVGIPLLAFVVVRGGYLFQLYIPLVLLPAVGVARLAGRIPLPDAAREGLVLLALPLVLLAWPTYPSADDARPPIPAPETELAIRLDATMGPQDSLVDCSGYALATLLLPRTLQPPPSMRDRGSCEGLRPATSVPGTQWLLAPTGQHTNPETLGWTSAWPEDLDLWEKVGPWRLYRSPPP